MLNHFLEAIVMFGLMSGIAVLSRVVIKKVPMLAAERNMNLEEDKLRLAQEKYPPVVDQNKLVGGIMFPLLVFVIAPFLTSFDALPWWRYLTDLLVLFLFYDFLYYLTHRFLFHGNGYFKRVHGLHHQARNPSHIDAQYVHPLETVIGLLLLYVSVIGVGLALGGFNTVALGIGLAFYTQINILNHTRVDLPFPFRWATWMSKKHHLHHVNMNSGNYATILLFYDKLFGTFE